MSSPPTFFLDGPPGEDPPRLAEGEAEHALRVLRLGHGDEILGLDGEGRRWRLRIVAKGKRDLGLEIVGAPACHPAPGDPGAPLPWIEIAVAWPRKSRAEGMISRLVQLGAARITPLLARHGGPAEAPEETPERWLRIAREACKQCGRTWLPRWSRRTSPEELARERKGAAIALLDPGAGMSLDTWLRSLHPAPLGVGTRVHPIVLVVGPEGGFSPEEVEAFLERDATTVQVAPHVLRIETAAEAALAVAGVILMG